MKKFTKIVAMLVAFGVFASGMFAVQASATEKVYLEERIILNEEFDSSDFEFKSGTLQNGEWTQVNANVPATVSDGVMKFQHDASGSTAKILTGAQCLFDKAKVENGELIVEIKAKKAVNIAADAVAGTEAVTYNPTLVVQLFYNADNAYRAFVGLALTEEMNTYQIRVGQGKYVAVYKNGVLDTTWSGLKAAQSTGLWNSIKLYSESTAAADMEIESVKITTWDPKTENVYFNADFENMTTMSDVADYGIKSHDADLITLDTTDGNKAIKISGNNSSAVQMDSFQSITTNEISMVLPEEYYFSYRIKSSGLTSTTACVCMQLFTNGMIKDQTSSSDRESGAVRVFLDMRSDALYAFDNNNSSNKYSTTIFGENKWVTVLIHVKGTTYDYYVMQEGEEEFTQVKENVPAQLQTTVGYNPNYFKFYVQGNESSNASVLIDDIRLYVPGDLTKIGENLYWSDADTITGSFDLTGSVDDTADLTGILALYDENGMLKDCKYKETTVEQVLGNQGKLSVSIDNPSEEATNARFFVWDSLSSLQPVMSMKAWETIPSAE